MEKKKKKILIFTTTYHPFVGGAEVAVKEITDRLGSDSKTKGSGEFDFHMITLRFDKNLSQVEQVGKIKVYRIGFTKNNPSENDLVKFPLKLNKLFFPFSACRKALELHKKNNYDAIWSIMASFAGFGAMFFKWLKPQVPYLLTLQEGDPIKLIKKKVFLVRPLFNRIFTKADLIQTISNYLADWARDMNYKGDIKIIPNAVNVKYFSQNYSSKELKDLKSQLGKRQDDQYIITTSRLVKKNAIGDIVKSLNYLPDSFKLLILGDGPNREELEVLTKKQRVENRVKFLGAIDYMEIPKYLKISDVFVRPSLSEGFGNSFIEAMASEIPVIATPVGGIVDFLKDKETGLFCDIQNPRSITDQIRWLEENVTQKEDIIKKAKRMVVRKYDWQKITKDMKTKVFNNLI